MSFLASFDARACWARPWARRPLRAGVLDGWQGCPQGELDPRAKRRCWWYIEQANRFGVTTLAKFAMPDFDEIVFCRASGC
jgi:hypothetical protein